MKRFGLTSPFLSGTSRVTKHMIQLLLALIPALIALVYYFGPGVLINLILAIIVALLAEALMLHLRGRPLKPFLTDGSAIVTAVLLAMALPSLAPWWLTVIGIVFAIVFAKHLYGGLGYNPFNPAMVAYVLLLISFPVEMTSWLPVDSINDHPLNFAQTFQAIFFGHLPNGLSFDTISGATPLDEMKTAIGQGINPTWITNHKLYGVIGGKGWEVVNLAFLAGGLFLIYRRVISWHIPAAMLASLAVISSITYFITPHTSATPLLHLLSGGTMICAFFIATDPVTASTTLRGRLIFGAGIGLLTYIIRVWGGYADGIAFAVLLMNMLVPTIDYYTQPVAYGHKK